MGEGLISFYKEKIKASWKIAFFSAIIIGLLAHIYKFTNTLPNNDSMDYVYSTLNVVSSGRWFLSTACALSGFFDLPWITGLLSLFWIGITAAIVADIFKMENPVLIALSSGILVTFPAITVTFFYQFTADGYMLAMALSAMAVRLSLIGDKKWSHTVLAALCLCLSCGIYQAYVSFALLLAIAHMMVEIFKGERENSEYLKWIARQAFVYIIGLLVYFIVWKVMMALQGAQATNYQGMNALGSASITTAIAKSLRSVGTFFFSWNPIEHGWTVYLVLNLLFVLLLAAVLIKSVFSSGVLRKPLQLALLIVAIVLTPFLACIWFFTSSKVFYHLIMLQSLAAIYIFALVQADKILRPRWKDVAGLLFAVLIFKFAVQANTCYFLMDKCYETSYAMATEMLTRIHMLDDGSVEKIVIVGDRETNYAAIQPDELAEVWIYSTQMKPDLLVNQERTYAFLKGFVGTDYELVDDDTAFSYLYDERVAEMGRWPAADSVQLMDGIIVLRLPDSIAPLE
jgi:hypothetical protein